MATVTEAVKESLLGSEKPADISSENRTTFLKLAQRDEDGELYLSEAEFINAIAPPQEDYHKIKREQYGILFDVADRQKRGKVSLNDWAAFNNLLYKPDAEYEVSFRFFDTQGTGVIKSDDFMRMYEENRGEGGIPFDFNSEWANLYIGARGKRHEMTYPQFAQMMRAMQGERIRQAFHYYDTDHDGFIEPEDFEKIIRATAGHKLSDHVLENLSTLCNISTHRRISYANVRAFQNVLREMDVMDMIVRSAAAKSADGRIDRTEFLNEAARSTRFSLFTPMEADILFHFAGLDAPTGRLALDDFAKVLDASWQTASAKLGIMDSQEVAHTVSRTTQALHGVLESAHHFLLGSIAGAFGAFMVYPIDLVKTRMQNQRGNVGQRLYKNSIHCAQTVIRNEGFRGLYSGVLPQLVGVAPEKAIKLTVNDLVRGSFTDKQTNKIALSAELLAGASAGACQVIFTNPLEIVKIRLQVQGELAKKADVPKRSAMWIVRNLGIVGLYKGVSACLLRDVPFSAIYFPTYNHLKRDMFGESPEKKLGILQLLTAGAIAGMPAAYLTTPCDVIKTRLQVEARKGDVAYNGLGDCAKKILKEEGMKAFFKGGPARILRSSPQFGFTLAGYELLNNTFPLKGSKEAELQKSTIAGLMEPGVGLREAKAPLPYLRSRNALKILLDLDQNFGQIKPPKEKKWPNPFGKPKS